MTRNKKNKSEKNTKEKNKERGRQLDNDSRQKKKKGCRAECVRFQTIYK